MYTITPLVSVSIGSLGQISLGSTIVFSIVTDWLSFFIGVGSGAFIVGLISTLIIGYLEYENKLHVNYIGSRVESGENKAESNLVYFWKKADPDRFEGSLEEASLDELSEELTIAVDEESELSGSSSIDRSLNGVEVQENTKVSELLAKLQTSPENFDQDYAQVLQDEFRSFENMEQELMTLRNTLDTVESVVTNQLSGHQGSYTVKKVNNTISLNPKQHEDMESYSNLKTLVETISKTTEQLSKKEDQVQNLSLELETIRQSITSIFSDEYSAADADAIINRVYKDVESGVYGKRKTMSAAKSIAVSPKRNKAARDLINSLQNESKHDSDYIQESLEEVIVELETFERIQNQLHHGADDTAKLKNRANDLKSRCNKLQMGLLNTTLKSRIDTVVSHLDRSSDLIILDRYVANQQLGMFEDLIGDIEGRSSEQPNNVEEVEKRLQTIKNQYIYADENTHSLIPQQFTNLAEELTSAATEERSKDNEQKAAGILFATDRMLTTVRQLYTDPKPKRLLEVLNDRQGS